MVRVFDPVSRTQSHCLTGHPDPGMAIINTTYIDSMGMLREDLLPFAFGLHARSDRRGLDKLTAHDNVWSVASVLLQGSAIALCCLDVCADTISTCVFVTSDDTLTFALSSFKPQQLRYYNLTKKQLKTIET
jgi:hypothetical protein